MLCIRDHDYGKAGPPWTEKRWTFYVGLVLANQRLPASLQQHEAFGSANFGADTNA
jgi:hypothetical protein